MGIALNAEDGHKIMRVKDGDGWKIRTSCPCCPYYRAYMVVEFTDTMGRFDWSYINPNDRLAVYDGGYTSGQQVPSPFDPLHGTFGAARRFYFYGFVAWFSTIGETEADCPSFDYTATLYIETYDVFGGDRKICVRVNDGTPFTLNAGETWSADYGPLDCHDGDTWVDTTGGLRSVPLSDMAKIEITCGACCQEAE